MMARTLDCKISNSLATVRYLTALLSALAIGNANAASITIPITGLTGTIDPITYSQPLGTTVETFTTSPIAVTLSQFSPSYFTFDTSTGVISDHAVMNVSFNNGKPGSRNADLTGVVTVDESGLVLCRS